MEKWKQNQGSEATYGKLIKIFKHAGYEQCAGVIRNLVSEYDNWINKSSDSKDGQTTLHRSPSPQPQLPEFPESVTLAVTTVQLEKHQESSGECIYSPPSPPQ